MAHLQTKPFRNSCREALSSRSKLNIWGFPKIRGTFLGVPIIRTIVYWGLYWVPPILGNYHIKLRDLKS